MRKTLIAALFICIFGYASVAQNETIPEKKGFKKENLFINGNIQAQFSTNAMLLGITPGFGYTLTTWADAGVALNYSYTRYRDVYQQNDKVKSNQFGGGPFLKLYPFKFLYAHAQLEKNFLRQKLVQPSGIVTAKNNFSVLSTLIGGGLCNNRIPGGGFAYISVLFDVSSSPRSPYKDQYGRTVPIVTAGIQIPLFNKSSTTTTNENEYDPNNGRRKPRSY